MLSIYAPPVGCELRAGYYEQTLFSTALKSYPVRVTAETAQFEFQMLFRGNSENTINQYVAVVVQQTLKHEF